MILFRKQNEHIKLVKYLHNIQNINVRNRAEYLEAHKDDISHLEWLIAYYEDRAAATPKELLEILMDERSPEDMRFASFLYYWVNYKRITGF